MVWGFENLSGMGRSGFPPPLISIVSRSIRTKFSMSQIVSKAVTKLVTSPLLSGNYVIFFLFPGPKSNFSIFKEIRLKFGGGVNSETPNSYFMSILLSKMNLIEIMGFYCHCFMTFTR